MRRVTLALAATFLLAACGGSVGAPNTPSPAAEHSPATAASPTAAAIPTATVAQTPVIGPDGHYPDVQVASDGTKHLIPLDEIRAGGPPKDGIPSIDRPLFAGASEWATLNYDGDGLVIGVEVGDKRRAYPFQIIVWHEIVNDVFDGQPLLITHCPLCGTGIVFVPVVAGEPVEFGVSGKLYNSDLLMYDRSTDSLWSQVTGTAVVGELTGTRLDWYPSEIMTWDDWQTTYPDSEVLTRETGYDRDYDDSPYDGYDLDSELWFPVTATDDRLHPKERVTGVELDAQTFGAYPDAAVVEDGPVNDTLAGIPLLIAADPMSGNNIVVFRRDVAGRVLTFNHDGDSLIDAETGTRWSFGGEAINGELAGATLTPVATIKGFWFAWFAFHQTTALWQPG